MEPPTRRSPSVRRYASRDSLYPLVVILGPSASGKSDLALAAAERFAGEIINFDSVQVYRHFDIGTAKTPPAERRGVLHHLIDIVEPAATFTAGDYAHLARKAIADVRARGGLPIMAGGTGLYLRAALQGLFQGPERDEMLRQRLEKRAASKPPGHLHRLLTRLDAASAGRIHAHDTPKLIRALEVCLRGRAPMSRQWEQNAERPLEGCEVIRIGLNPPRAMLYERIARRSGKMFASGLTEEVQRLLDQGISRQARPFGSLGYRQALQYGEGRLSAQQAAEETAKLTRRYAKRQMTWFRREPGVEWFAGFGDDPAIVERVSGWLAGRLAPYTGA
jgi:tRNA dimethylallyltransferase